MGTHNVLSHQGATRVPRSTSMLMCAIRRRPLNQSQWAPDTRAVEDRRGNLTGFAFAVREEEAHDMSFRHVSYPSHELLYCKSQRAANTASAILGRPANVCPHQTILICMNHTTYFSTIHLLHLTSICGRICSC